MVNIVLFSKFRIARIPRMIQESRRMCPRNISILNESTFIKNIEIPKVEKYFSYNIGAFYEMGTDGGSITISET